ncbi:MAG: RluA family pseudouridine synthase [Clostridia bacterium]|nr:RluA family pseudouridine synthase [Clostridia bacterium]
MTKQYATVPEELAGGRLDAAAAELFNLTRSAIQGLIEKEALTVNGKSCDKKYKLKSGDELCLSLPDPEPCDVMPQNIPLEIVYEDEHLAVVNKEKGMVVHPAPGNPDGTLVNALLYHLDSLSDINGVLRPGIVHRIDKNTSGLLMVAKNDKAHLHLSEQIKEHSFFRQYECIALGRMKEQTGEIDAPIGRHPVKRQQMAIVKDGRQARTRYEVIAEYNGFSHLKCTLYTGRTHQIRVHLSSIGHPILGDSLYGGGNTPFEKKHAALLSEQTLHAKTLGFVHPATGEYMEFTSDLPDYFKRVLEILKNT